MMNAGEKLYELRFNYAGKAAKVWSRFATGGEEGLLLSLYEQKDEEVLAGNLAQKLGLTSGRIANILKQLEKKEMVQRREGQDDKRKVYVSLTEAGRAYIKDVRSQEIEQYNQVMNSLGEEDAERFMECLEKIFASV